MAVDNSGSSPAVAEREPDLSTSKVKVSLPSPVSSSPNSSSSPNVSTAGLSPPSSSSAAQLAMQSAVGASGQPIHSIDAILGLKAAAERSGRQFQHHHLHPNHLHNLHHYHHLSPNSHPSLHHPLHHHLAHHLNNNNDSNHLNHHHFLSSHLMLNGGGGSKQRGGSANNSSASGSSVLASGGNIYVPPGCHSGGDSENNFSDHSSGPPSLSSGSADYHFEQIHSQHHQNRSSPSGGGVSAGMEYGADHKNSETGAVSNNSRRGLKRKIKGEPVSGTYPRKYLFLTSSLFSMSRGECSS